jgi:hypothetical protein
MSNLLRAVVTTVALLASSQLHANTDHFNAEVDKLESTLASTNCFYFTLHGVAVADPVVAGSPWFAMERAGDAGRDAYATLLAAKLSGAKLRITTSGSVVCGYAGVVYVILE